MKDIFFRSWNKWGMNYSTLKGVSEYSISKESGAYFWEPNTVFMLSTGLKDKNGKDIYEGDILQYKHEYKCRAWNKPGENRSLATTQPDVTIGKDKVWFDNGCFRLGYIARLHEMPNVFKHGENHASEWTDTYTDFEVIGNIYENPELL